MLGPYFESERVLTPVLCTKHVQLANETRPFVHVGTPPSALRPCPLGNGHGSRRFRDVGGHHYFAKSGKSLMLAMKVRYFVHPWLRPSHRTLESAAALGALDTFLLVENTIVSSRMKIKSSTFFAKYVCVHRQSNDKKDDFYRRAKRRIWSQVLAIWLILIINTTAVLMVYLTHIGRSTPVIPMGFHVRVVGGSVPRRWVRLNTSDNQSQRTHFVLMRVRFAHPFEECLHGTVLVDSLEPLSQWVSGNAAGWVTE